jgi:NADPH:quinone reductase-like Zn-dependent oxidoreductase
MRLSWSKSFYAFLNTSARENNLFRDLLGTNGMSDNKGLVVVAGASGHIGHFVVEELLRRGYQVKALVRETADRFLVRNLEAAGAEVRIDLSQRLVDMTFDQSNFELSF